MRLLRTILVLVMFITGITILFLTEPVIPYVEYAYEYVAPYVEHFVVYAYELVVNHPYYWLILALNILLIWLSQKRLIRKTSLGNRVYRTHWQDPVTIWVIIIGFAGIGMDWFEFRTDGLIGPLFLCMALLPVGVIVAYWLILVVRQHNSEKTETNSPDTLPKPPKVHSTSPIPVEPYEVPKGDRLRYAVRQPDPDDAP